MIGSQIEDHFHGCPPENTKLMNDIVFDEVNHTNDFNFCDQYGAHFEKYSIISRMNRRLLVDGLMSPIITILHTLNGYGATVGWSNSEGWYMKSAWI